MMQHVPKYIFQAFRQGDLPSFSSANVVEPENGISYILPTEIGENIILGSMIYSIRQIGSSKVAKLIDIEISEPYRGKGYGKLCVNWLLNQAKSNGADYVQLFVFEHRQPAMGLYASLGFEILKTRKNGLTMIHHLRD